MNHATHRVLASGLCERIGIDGRIIHEANDLKQPQILIFLRIKKPLNMFLIF